MSASTNALFDKAQPVTVETKLPGGQTFHLDAGWNDTTTGIAGTCSGTPMFIPWPKVFRLLGTF